MGLTFPNHQGDDHAQLRGHAGGERSSDRAAETDIPSSTSSAQATRSRRSPRGRSLRYRGCRQVGNVCDEERGFLVSLVAVLSYKDNRSRGNRIS